MKTQVILLSFLALSAAVSAQFVKIDYETNTPLHSSHFRLRFPGVFIDDNMIVLGGGTENKDAVCLMQSLNFKTGAINQMVEPYFDLKGKKLVQKHLKTQFYPWGKGSNGEHLFIAYVDNSIHNTEKFLKLVAYKNGEFKVLKNYDGIDKKYISYLMPSMNFRFAIWTISAENDGKIHVYDLEKDTYKSFGLPNTSNQNVETVFEDYYIENNGRVVFIAKITEKPGYKSSFYLGRYNPFQDSEVELKLLKYRNADRLYTQDLSQTKSGDYIITSVTNNSKQLKDEVQCFTKENETDEEITPMVSDLLKFKQSSSISTVLFQRSIRFGEDKLIQVLSYAAYKGASPYYGCFKIMVIGQDGKINTVMESIRDIASQMEDVFVHTHDGNIYVFATMPDVDKIDSFDDLTKYPTLSYKIRCYRFDSEFNKEVFTFDKAPGSCLLGFHIADGERVALNVFDRGENYKGPSNNKREGYILLNLD